MSNGYENGYFAGWNAISFLTAIVIAVTFWAAAFTVKHLNAVYKSVSQCLSMLVCFYVGDNWMNFNQEKALGGDAMTNLSINSVVIVLCILVFSMNAEPKKNKQVGKEGQGKVAPAVEPVEDAGKEEKENETKLKKRTSAKTEYGTESLKKRSSTGTGTGTGTSKSKSRSNDGNKRNAKKVVVEAEADAVADPSPTTVVS